MNSNNALSQPRAAIDTLLSITAAQPSVQESQPSKDRSFDAHMADQAEQKTRPQSRREASQDDGRSQSEQGPQAADKKDVDSAPADTEKEQVASTQSDSQSEPLEADASNVAKHGSGTAESEELVDEAVPQVIGAGIAGIDTRIEGASDSPAAPLNGGVLGGARRISGTNAETVADQSVTVGGKVLPSAGMNSLNGGVSGLVDTGAKTGLSPAENLLTPTGQPGTSGVAAKFAHVSVNNGGVDSALNSTLAPAESLDTVVQQESVKATTALTTQLSMAAGKTASVSETTLLAQAVTAAVDKVTSGTTAPVEKADLSTIKPTAAPRLIAPNVTKYQMEGQPAVTQTRVNVPVGQPQWPSAVAEKVMWMSSQRVTSAEIHLDPPELGPLQVRVTVNQEAASVTFASQHSAVREALDLGAFRLREMFEAEGLDLANVDVSDQALAQGSEEGEGQNGGQGGTAEHGEEGEELVSSTPISSHDGLVDHYV